MNKQTDRQKEHQKKQLISLKNKIDFYKNNINALNVTISITNTTKQT